MLTSMDDDEIVTGDDEYAGWTLAQLLGEELPHEDAWRAVRSQSWSDEAQIRFDVVMAIRGAEFFRTGTDGVLRKRCWDPILLDSHTAGHFDQLEDPVEVAGQILLIAMVIIGTVAMLATSALV